MKVKLEDVSIGVEVILFNDEKVIILSKGNKKMIWYDKQVFPVWDKGRLIEFMMGFEGEYFKSFVVGRDKKIVRLGHILDNDIDDENIINMVLSDNIQFIDSNQESNRLLLYIE